MTGRPGPYPPGVALRGIQPRDHAAVLALNDANVPAVSAMGEDRLIELLGLADRADVVDIDGAVAGFVLTFAPGSTYDSPNYRAFSVRYGTDFYYLDRITIDVGARRRGLGTFVYDEIEQVARPYGRLTLEVNTRPPNEVSMTFHRRRGFVEVGTRGDDHAQVALLAKELG